MDDSKMLIVGAHGQLGRALQARFPKAIAVDREELDITSRATLDAFDWGKISVILNAAAYTNVDAAQTPQGRQAAWQINAQAVANLTKTAIEHDLTMVHVSSETVFDGAKGAYKEDDPLCPLSVYAQSKAAGDIAAAVNPKHYIVRPSWLIGEGYNFVSIIIGLGAKNISPKVVQDQVGRLTFTHTLVDAIEKLLQTNAAYGIYNVTNDGDVVSWAAVAQAVFRELGRDDISIIPVTTDEYFKDKPEAAPRPRKGDFDLSKIKATGLRLDDWRDDLREYVKAETTKE